MAKPETNQPDTLGDAPLGAEAKPTLLPKPEHHPAAYSYHAYCRYENRDHDWREFPHEPEGCQTLGEAVAALRAYGWIIHRDRTGTCPKCAKALGIGRWKRAALATADGPAANPAEGE